MASSRTTEAKLILSGEDRGASASVEKVVAAVKHMESAAKVSKDMEKVARALQEIEKQSRATDSVMRAQRGFAQAEAGLKATQAAAEAAARAMTDAKVARAAYDGVRATKGSEEAAKIMAVTKAVRDAGSAYRKAESEVRRATAAVAAETATLQHAERAASAFGIDLAGLATHQSRLRTATESATNAVRAQIRVEDQAARAAAHHAREDAERQRHMARHGALGVAASAAAGYVSAHGVIHGATDAMKAGARLQHETVALKNAGRTPEELGLIERASRETVKAVPTATFEENLKVINETVSAFGSLDHAIEHLTFMQKASAAVHAAANGKITDSAGELGNKMARFAEERGSAMDGHRFERETEGLVRAMVFSGGNFNPHEAINFAQQAKSSLRGYNEEFLTSYMPSIVGTMKGERAGTAANAFNNVINGKVNDKKQAEEWMKYGLLDPKQVIMKAGHATAWQTGAVKDTTLAHQNPVEWMEKTVLPALKAKGVNIDDDEALSKVFSTMFRQNTSNFFANEVGLKSFRDRLHKDAALQKQTGSLDDIYQRNLKEDPTEGTKAFKAGLENVMAAATSPLMQPAAVALKSLAEGLQFVALAAKDHPMIAAGAGGTAVAGGLAASGYMTYKLATGFGLPAAATELTVAAKMLQASAVKPGGVGPGEAVKAAPLAALGLFGVTLGTAAGAAFATYATTKEMPKVAAEKGATGLDPATGGAMDANPMGGLAPDRPWLRDWLVGTWVKSEAESTLDRETARGREMLRRDAGVPYALPPRAHTGMIDAEAAERQATEAGTKAGDAFGKAIVAAPLPPVRPDVFRPITDKAQEAGTQAGQSIVDGVRTKAPDVQEQGVSIYQRLKDTFSQGIMIPMSFGAGEGAGGGSGVQTASFGGGGGLGGMIRKASLGGGAIDSGGGGSAGLGGGSGHTVPRGAFRVGTGAGDSWQEAVMRAEGTAGADPYNVVLGNGKYGLPSKPLTSMTLAEAYRFGRTVRARHGSSSALGAFQIVGQTMKEFMGEAGLGWGDTFSPENQRKLADVIRRRQGFGAWEGFKVHRGELGNARRLGAYKTTPDDPRLVRGPDGRDGLDLGDGRMRMPTGEIRPITKSGLEIPDAPAGGFGGGRAGSYHSAAERMESAAERMENAAFHGQVDVRLLGGGGRVTAMRAKGKGMSADMGVSMPGAKEADDDWL